MLVINDLRVIEPAALPSTGPGLEDLQTNRDNDDLRGPYFDADQRAMQAVDSHHHH
jgi:hypothetical protein